MVSTGHVLTDGSVAVHLEVAPYYAAMVQAVDATTGERVLPRDAYEGAGITWPRHVGDAITAWPTDVSATLGRFSFDREALLKQGNGLSLVAYQGVAPARGLGPVPVTIKLLGYEKTTHEISLPRLDGPLQTLAIPVQPTGQPTADVEIQLLGTSWSVPIDSRFPAGMLRLINADTGQVVESAVESLTESRQVLTGFPIGAYEASFLVHQGLDVLTPLEGPGVQLDGGRVSLTFDFSGSGAVEFDVLTGRGASFEGSLVVICRNVAAGRQAMVRFMERPYRLLGVPEGQLSLELSTPKMQDGAPPRSVPVEPGRLSTATLFADL